MRIIISLPLAVVAVAAVSAGSAAHATEPPGDVTTDCEAIAESLASGADTEATNVTLFARAIAIATESSADATNVPLTVFLPTDDAMEEIPVNVIDALLADEAMMASLVDAHVIADEAVGVDELAATGEATAADGSTLTFEIDGDVLVINGGEASVVCPDLEMEGATIHVIDAVLRPARGEAAPGSSVPGSSVPAFTPEQEDVATAFETAVDSSLTYDDQAPHIEDAEELRETIENYPAAAEVVMGISADVTSVEIDGDTAAITYVLFFNDVDAGYGELDATMLNVDGTWVVPHDQYCAFQAQARNPCPA